MAKTVKEVDQKIENHEEVCAERYDHIHERLDRIEGMLNKIIWGALVGFGAVVVTVIQNNIG